MSEFSKTEYLAPFSMEAEQAVLGCVLIDPACFLTLAQFITASDFFVDQHKWIWSAYNRLASSSHPIDLVTVHESLDATGQLEEMGRGYLLQMVNSVPTAVNAEAYGRIVEQTATRRAIIQAAEATARLALEWDGTPSELIGRSSTIMDTAKGRHSTTAITIHDAALKQREEIKEAEAARLEGRILTVSTSIAKLDEFMSGGQSKGDLTWVVARAGKGKSILLKDMAMVNALAGNGVAIFSLEMRSQSYLKRIIHPIVSGTRQKLGNMSDVDWLMLDQYIEQLAEIPIWMIDGSTERMSVPLLKYQVKKLKGEYGIKLVIVDYIQLLDAGLPGNPTDSQRADYVSRELKGLAQEEDVVVAGASAVRRSPNNRTGMSDMRHGEGQVHDADWILALNEPEVQDFLTIDTLDKPITIDLEKARDGTSGSCEMLLHAKTLSFIPIPERGRLILPTFLHDPEPEMIEFPE